MSNDVFASINRKVIKLERGSRSIPAKSTFRRAAAFIFASLLASSAGATDYFVSEYAGAANRSGLTWSDALDTVTAALNRAASGDTVHIAEGVYAGSLVVPHGVTLRGGYPPKGGVNTSPYSHRTVIDGRTTPATAIVVSGNAVIDGLVIWSGDRVYPDYDSGIEVRFGNSVRVLRTTFELIGCYGVKVIGGKAVIDQCTFQSGRSGVYVYGAGSQVNVKNSFFFDLGYGLQKIGGSEATVTMSSCTIARSMYDGIHFESGTLSVRNTIICDSGRNGVFAQSNAIDWQCNVVHNSFAGNYAGVPDYTGLFGNLSVDPGLANGGGLNADSPCIDAGLALGAPTTDYLGRVRPVGNGFDIGAIESGSATMSPRILKTLASETSIVPGGAPVIVSALIENPNAMETITLTSFDWNFLDANGNALAASTTLSGSTDLVINPGDVGTTSIMLVVHQNSVPGDVTVELSVTGTGLASGALLGDAAVGNLAIFQVLGCATSHCGDCNGDGAVSILDALSLARINVGMQTMPNFGTATFDNCNVEGAAFPSNASRVDILDAFALAQSLVGANTLVCCR